MTPMELDVEYTRIAGDAPPQRSTREG
jgi:hypothetical protein